MSGTNVLNKKWGYVRELHVYRDEMTQQIFAKLCNNLVVILQNTTHYLNDAAFLLRMTSLPANFNCPKIIPIVILGQIIAKTTSSVLS